MKIETAILLYGIYSLLISLSGLAAFSVALIQTGHLFSEMSDIWQQWEAVLQVFIFLIASIASFVPFKKNLKFYYFYCGILGVILVWYIVFEIVVQGVIKELNAIRLIASAVYMALPAILVLMKVKEEIEKQRSSQKSA